MNLIEWQPIHNSAWRWISHTIIWDRTEDKYWNETTVQMITPNKSWIHDETSKLKMKTYNYITAKVIVEIWATGNPLQKELRVSNKKTR